MPSPAPGTPTSCARPASIVARRIGFVCRSATNRFCLAHRPRLSPRVIFQHLCTTPDAVEVLGDRARRDVLCHESHRFERRRVQDERAPVAREDQGAAGREHALDGRDECRVVALDVERGVHALGVREGRRIAEHEVVGWRRRRPPRRATRRCRRARTRCAARPEPVGVEVPLRPGQIRGRQVHGRARRAAAGGRADGRRAGVGEQVQEAGACSQLAQPRARVPVVEEEPGVEVVRQVHLEQQPVLRDGACHRSLRLPLVLRRAPLPLPLLHEDPLRLHTQDLGNDRADRLQPCVRLGGVHLRRRSVLGDVGPPDALVGARTLVEVDRHREIGQVGVVDAIAADTGSPRPLPVVLRHLREPVRELAGPGYRGGHRSDSRLAHNIRRLRRAASCRDPRRDLPRVRRHRRTPTPSPHPCPVPSVRLSRAFMPSPASSPGSGETTANRQPANAGRTTAASVP